MMPHARCCQQLQSAPPSCRSAPFPLDISWSGAESTMASRHCWVCQRKNWRSLRCCCKDSSTDAVSASHICCEDYSCRQFLRPAEGKTRYTVLCIVVECSFLHCVSGEMSSPLLQRTSHMGLTSLMQELLHASDHGTRPGPQFSPAVQACYQPSHPGRETGFPPHLWRAARNERPGLRQTHSYVLKTTDIYPENIY